MKCAIVIPVYKEIPTFDETESLKQCAKIFTNRHISIVCPKDLSITEYYKIFNNYDYSIARFSKKYFKSTFSYSRLLLSKKFYEKYNRFEYILIYQPDSWVFSDELDYWCEAGYSYIGAPWIGEKGIMNLAGNGGFCLRKVKDMINLLSIKKSPKLTIKEFFQSYCKKDNLNDSISSIIQFACTRNYFKTTLLNEDYAIVTYGQSLLNNFKIAPPEVAIKFAFEKNPEKLYKINNQKLPFGCHAYKKYNPHFWSKYINYLNNTRN